MPLASYFMSLMEQGLLYQLSCGLQHESSLFEASRACNHRPA